MFLKLGIAAAIVLVTIYAMVRVQRYLKGDSGSLFERKPRRTERDAAPNELEQFIASYRRDRAGGTSAASAPEGTAAPAAAAPLPNAAPAARPAFLAGPSKLLYLVLKAGLPDHHVFANCRLADVLEAPPPQPPVWGQARADFVVCRNDLQIVAVVEVAEAGAPPDPVRRALEDQVRTAGVRYLRVAPSALPKPADVRALIYPA